MHKNVKITLTNYLQYSKTQENTFIGVFFVIYLVCSVALTFFYATKGDAILYWVYGQDMAWGYTDCPPLIGWVTHQFSIMFDNHIAIFGILRTITSLLTAWALYSFVRLFHEKRIALLVAITWLITPATVHAFMTHWTYHSLTAMFWAWTLYAAYKTFISKKPIWFYITGLCLAGLIYSQYEGIFLILSLFLCATLFKPFRKLWRIKHTYFGILLLPFFLYLPHLWWLSQHHWGGITFLLSYHVSHGQKTWFHGSKSLINDLVVNYNLFFLIGLWLLWKNHRTICHIPKYAYLGICSGLILVVYLLASVKIDINYFWIAPFYLGFLLLTAPLFIRLYPRMFYAVLLINFLLMAANTFNLTYKQWMPRITHTNLNYIVQKRCAQAMYDNMPEKQSVVICAKLYSPQKICNGKNVCNAPASYSTNWWRVF